MKPFKKKKIKQEFDAETPLDQDDGRVVPFEALAELTSSDVIAQVKLGMSNIEPLDHEGEFDDEAAA